MVHDNIRGIFVLNTEHLDDDSRDWLDSESQAYASRLSDGTGWFVYAYPELNADEDPMPAVLRTIIAYARQQGCAYVLLGGGENPHPDLPSFLD